MVTNSTVRNNDTTDFVWTGKHETKHEWRTTARLFIVSIRTAIADLVFVADCVRLISRFFLSLSLKILIPGHTQITHTHEPTRCLLRPRTRRYRSLQMKILICRIPAKGFCRWPMPDRIQTDRNSLFVPPIRRGLMGNIPVRLSFVVVVVVVACAVPRRRTIGREMGRTVLPHPPHSHSV